MGKRWRCAVAALVASASIVAACGGGDAKPLLPAPQGRRRTPRSFRELSPGEYRDYMEGGGR